MNGIDLAVILVMLGILIYVGARSSKKEASSEEFLTSGHSLNKFQAGLSLAATDFGGSGLVGAIGYCYLVGMSGCWWDLAAAPAMLFVGLFLAKKFNGCDANTIPEYLGHRYSASARYVSAFMHLCTVIASLSVQFTISGTVLHVVTGLDANLSLFIAMILALLLTSGGLRTVVNTDATQFLMILASVLCCVVAGVFRVGGLANLTSQVSGEFMRIDQLGFVTPLSWFFMCTLGYSTSQHYVQRMISSKNESTARFSAFFTAGFYLVISIALGLIGVTASVLLPGIENTNEVFPRMLTILPHGLIGLGVVGVFAATISTATSQLHALSILFVNDLYQPLSGEKDDKKIVKISRIAIVVSGLMAIALSLKFSNIVTILYTAGLFYTTAVFSPLFLGLNTKLECGKKATIAILAATFGALIWQYGLINLGGFFAAVPANLAGVIIGAVLLFLLKNNNVQSLGKR